LLQLKLKPVALKLGVAGLTVSPLSRSTNRALNHSSVLLRQNIGYFTALFLLGLMVASLGPTLGVLAGQTHSPLQGDQLSLYRRDRPGL
jgi:hypothetical protein